MPKRSSIFETNSSSTHSVTICEGTDYVCPEVGEEGVVIRTGDFGWERAHYTDWRTKASYALTYAKNDGKTDDAALLMKVLKEHLKAPVSFEPDKTMGGYDWGYIDHQSLDEAQRIFQSERTVKDFVFGAASTLETDNDNG